MADDNETAVLRAKDITRPRDFSLAPNAGERAVLAERLGILAIRKLSFAGRVAPDGDADLLLEAEIGATVVQPCVVTLAPVTTRIDEKILRRYLSEMPEIPEGDEIEIPEDDSAEAMPREIDLDEVMAEALALALPAWPRAEGAEPIDLSVTEPGKAPMSDDDAKPFAALRSLRERMEDPDESEG